MNKPTTHDLIDALTVTLNEIALTAQRMQERRMELLGGPNWEAELRADFLEMAKGSVRRSE